MGRKRRQNHSPIPKTELKEDISTLSQSLSEENIKTEPRQTIPEPQSTRPYDLGDLQYAVAHGFYDINQNFSNAEQPAIPQSFSNTQDQSFNNSPSLPQNNFPLADFSAMMFPNSEDPFAYPSQSADFNYNVLMKNVNSTETANFPFSTAPDGDRLPRNGFVPPSSTFMFAGNAVDSQTPAQDLDVQLLGPMPAYMMQGATLDSPLTPSMTLGSGRTTASGSPARMPPQMRSSRAESTTTKIYPTGAPNVNLDALLGGEEWNGLPADRSAMNGFVSANTMNVSDGSFRKRPGVQLPQATQQSGLQFQDLEPGVLGWGLEGF
jgi:hypothetical protein